MAKIYERPLAGIIYYREKNWSSFSPRSQTLSEQDSTCLVDGLEIPRIFDFLYIYYFPCMIEGP